MVFACVLFLHPHSFHGIRAWCRLYNKHEATAHLFRTGLTKSAINRDLLYKHYGICTLDCGHSLSVESATGTTTAGFADLQVFVDCSFLS